MAEAQERRKAKDEREWEDRERDMMFVLSMDRTERRRA
jgi:hypothetical protein